METLVKEILCHTETVLMFKAAKWITIGLNGVNGVCANHRVVKDLRRQENECANLIQLDTSQNLGRSTCMENHF